MSQCCIPNESGIEGFCYYAEIRGEEHRCESGCGRELPPSERCTYCGVEYPKLISYHHSTEECRANEAAAKNENAYPPLQPGEFPWP